jgi:hypothetical protein
VTCDFVSQSIGGSNHLGRGTQVNSQIFSQLFLSTSRITKSRPSFDNIQANTTQNSSSGAGPSSDYGGDTPMSLHDVQSTPGLNVLDLELLHNYITSTANTLHTDPALKTLWKINVGLVILPTPFALLRYLARPEHPIRERISQGNLLTLNRFRNLVSATIS